MTDLIFPDNPFVGLRPFKSDESLLFFGREDQTVELLQHLHHNRFVAVVGSSGSGKSSLVRAGLVPKLKAGFLVEADEVVDDRDHWHVAIMKPGHAPLTNLAAALLKEMEVPYGPEGVAALLGVIQRGIVDQPDEALRLALDGGQDLARLDKALHQAINDGGVRVVLEALAPLLKDTSANLLLIVDQFEEIFRFREETDTQHEEAADFVSIMLALAEQRELPIFVVMTMRSDFLRDCDVFRGLPEALNRSQYLVPRLTRSQLKDAIGGPIKLFHAQISQPLVNRLLNDADKDRDGLPVVQHALMRTWQKWEENGGGQGPITYHYYDLAGTTARALSDHADEALKGRDEEEARLTRILFRLLTDTDASNRRIRRPARLSEVAAVTGATPEAIRKIIRRFQDDRRSFLVESEGDDPLIDISHESLIRQWGTLRDWVDEEAGSAHTYKRLAETAVLWKAGKARLYGDPELLLALNWREREVHNAAWAKRYHPASYPDDTYALAIRFLDQSLEQQRKEEVKREQAQQLELAQAQKQAQQAQALAAAQAKAAQQAHVLAEEQQRRAEEQRKRVRVVAVIAIVAAAFAVAALVFWGDARIAGQAALDSAEEAELERDRAKVAEQAALDSAEVAQLERDRAKVAEQAARFDQDRARIAEQAALDSAEVAQLERDRARRAEQAALDSAVIADSLRAKADTLRQVAEANLDSLQKSRKQTVGISLASKSKRAQENDQHELGALLAREAYRFNEESEGEFLNEIYDALRLALNALQGDTATSVPLPYPPDDPPSDWVRSVVYSPDDRIAWAGNDGKVRLWDQDTGEGPKVLGSHDEVEEGVQAVRSLTFSPDGKCLASVGDDGNVRLWGVTSCPQAVLSGHQEGVRAVAFGPDSLLASGGVDGTVRVWNAATGDSLHVLRGHGGPVNTVAFSPDGSLLASGGADGTVRVWNAATGDSLHVLRGLAKTVHAVAFSPDGRRLATGGDDTFVRVWDPATGDSLHVLRGHGGPVNTVAFSPDGITLASGSSDQTVRLWEVARLDVGPIILRSHTDWVLSLTFSPDSNFLVSGSADRTVLRWNVNAELLARAICGAVERELSPTEWTTFVGPDIPYEDYQPCSLASN